MTAMLAIVGAYVVAVAIGKRRRGVTPGVVILLLLLALLQSAVILYDMLTRGMPKL